MRDPDQPVRDGFDLGDFLRSTLIGGLMGGLSGVAFYGMDKAVGALKGSLSGTKYTYNMIENPGPLANMDDNPAKNFYGGKYNATTLTQDTVFYRAGKEGVPYGQWFTTTPSKSVAQVRIDLAVKPQWINPATGVLDGTSVINMNYGIKIPAGTTIYSGPVGYQGGVYLGGEDIIQTFISKPWCIKGVEVVSSTPLY